MLGSLGWLRAALESTASKVCHNLGLGFEVWGLGFGVLGLGFRVQGLGFGVWDLRLRTGFRAMGLNICGEGFAAFLNWDPDPGKSMGSTRSL